jgi:hypothetical protein
MLALPHGVPAASAAAAVRAEGVQVSCAAASRSAEVGAAVLQRSTAAPARVLLTRRPRQVLLNLNGWTAGHRNDVFAARAAPVQAGYLGYPATMGAPYMDYFLTDRLRAAPPSRAPQRRPSAPAAAPAAKRAAPCGAGGSRPRHRARLAPPPRTKWTRRVPHPVLIGHAESLSGWRRRPSSQATTRSASRCSPGAARPPPPSFPLRIPYRISSPRGRGLSILGAGSARPEPRHRRDSRARAARAARGA